MFFAACSLALLCLVSVSRSAPLACEDLLRPLDDAALRSLAGRWALVAGSLNDTAAENILERRDSIAIDVHNSSYTQASRIDGQCHYHPHNISVEDHNFTMKEKTFNFTVTFIHTSCQDCMVLTLDVKSPHYQSVDFYLFSRRREVDQKVMEEFRAQVECLKMLPPVLMDPSKELCPEQTATEPAAQTEEKA